MKNTLSLFIIILFFGYISNIHATDLSSSCVPITHLGEFQKNTTSFEAVNNCGQCVHAYGNTYKDGKAIGWGGWFCNMQPGEAKKGYFSTDPSKFGTGFFQHRITRVTTCDIKCP